MPDGQEIIVAPFSVYLADIGTAYPEVDEDPAAAWGFLGDGGKLSQGDDGLVLTHGQTVDMHKTGGRTGAVKATRSSEELMISFDLVDISLGGLREGPQRCCSRHHRRRLWRCWLQGTGASPGARGCRVRLALAWRSFALRRWRLDAI